MYVCCSEERNLTKKILTEQHKLKYHFEGFLMPVHSTFWLPYGCPFSNGNYTKSIWKSTAKECRTDSFMKISIKMCFSKPNFIKSSFKQNQKLEIFKTILLSQNWMQIKIITVKKVTQNCGWMWSWVFKYWLQEFHSFMDMVLGIYRVWRSNRMKIIIKWS